METKQDLLIIGDEEIEQVSKLLESTLRACARMNEERPGVRWLASEMQKNSRSIVSNACRQLVEGGSL